MALGNALAIIQALAAVVGAASAAKAANTKNTLATTGTPAGGAGQPQAQDIFSVGQRPPEAPGPAELQIASDPNMQATMNALALSQMPPVEARSGQGQQPYVNDLSSIMPPSLVNQNIPVDNKLGAFLAGLEGSSEALSAVAPLLGLADRRRGAALGSPAGGHQGQVVFQPPQRQTLAQILAALPRMM